MPSSSREGRLSLSGDHHPLRPTEVGAGDDGVTAARHLEVGHGAEGGLDLVGDALFVAADRLDVDQLAGQGDGVGGEVEHGPIQPAGAASYASPCRSSASASSRPTSGVQPQPRARSASSAPVHTGSSVHAGATPSASVTVP
jgi:hypothetical protein